MPTATTHQKLQLPFPLFCAEFIDEKALIVAGGGGESRSGVGNGISIIDLINIKEELELGIHDSFELPKTEDAVMSMALIPRRNSKTPIRTLIAGVNQDEKQIIDTKKNEHFRYFKIVEEWTEH